jgi:hypothetical protein
MRLSPESRNDESVAFRILLQNCFHFRIVTQRSRCAPTLG